MLPEKSGRTAIIVKGWTKSMFVVGMVIILLIVVTLFRNSLYQKKMQKQELEQQNENLASKPQDQDE